MKNNYVKQKTVSALVGSTNPAKVTGAEQALMPYFEKVNIKGIKVETNVSDEPIDKDIYIGAKNRVTNLIRYAKENNISADYYMGIESGITNLLGKWTIINVAVVVDKNGYESWGTSSGFPVPEKLVKDIIDTDLSTVIDRLFDTTNLRSNVGGISYLTHGEISRIDLSRDAFIMAMTQFVNDNWKD